VRFDHRRLFTLVLALSSARCAATTAARGATGADARIAQREPERPLTIVAQPAIAPREAIAAAPPSDRDRVVSAEQQATGGARRVLSTARALIDDEVVIRGSCYTWLSATYRRAGGPFSTVFSGDRRGRYANAEQLRPGDWIHFINHSYGNVTHSAIFIGWTDRASSTALTASYPGQNREAPGRYRDYELTSVYRIDRMRD
jgi:hypothetical protein